MLVTAHSSVRALLSRLFAALLDYDPPQAVSALPLVREGRFEIEGGASCPVLFIIAE
jgi:hypothetical protein